MQHKKIEVEVFYMDAGGRWLKDLQGIDHFPIILESYHHPRGQTTKVAVYKADWNLFKDLCF